MSKKDIFNAVKVSFGMYAGLFKDVSQEIGLEKALTLHANQGKAMGAAVAGMLRAELGRKKLSTAALESVEIKIAQGFGMTSEIEKHRSSLKAKYYSCPVYEGCLSAGLDHKTIEMMCSQFGTSQYEEIKKVFPRLSGCVKFRSAPEEPCVEEYVILK